MSAVVHATQTWVAQQISTATDPATNPTLPARRSATRHHGPAYMVVGTQTAADLQQAADAGATHAHVTADWDKLQTNAGLPLVEAAVDDLHLAIIDARTAGLKVCLEVRLQYAPDYILTNIPAFTDQDGNTWTAEQASGDNIRDWVFSAQARDFIADFAHRLFTALPWTDIERVKLGGLQKGELQFPGDGTERWMAYSAPAQTGTGLPVGMAPCPLPGHIPSTGTTWTADDAIFNAWYQQSLTNWMTWWIGQHRVFFDGPIYVQHPGPGLRPVSQTPTSTEQGENFRINASRGLDWDTQLGAYPDPDVRPYTTWIDADHFWPADPYSETNDGNAAPWYHLLRTARRHTRAGHLWGENTGGQTSDDLNRIMTTGARGWGYEGLAWLDHASLSGQPRSAGRTAGVSGTGPATYADLATFTAVDLPYTVPAVVAPILDPPQFYVRNPDVQGTAMLFLSEPPPYDSFDIGYRATKADGTIVERTVQNATFPFTWNGLRPDDTEITFTITGIVKGKSTPGRSPITLTPDDFATEYKAQYVDQAMLLRQDAVIPWSTFDKAVTQQEIEVLGTQQRVAWFKFHLTGNADIRLSTHPSQIGFDDSYNSPAEDLTALWLYRSSSENVPEKLVTSMLTLHSYAETTDGPAARIEQILTPGWYFVAVGHVPGQNIEVQAQRLAIVGLNTVLNSDGSTSTVTPPPSSTEDAYTDDGRRRPVPPKMKITKGDPLSGTPYTKVTFDVVHGPNDYYTWLEFPQFNGDPGTGAGPLHDVELPSDSYHPNGTYVYGIRACTGDSYYADNVLRTESSERVTIVVDNTGGEVSG